MVCIDLYRFGILDSGSRFELPDSRYSSESELQNLKTPDELTELDERAMHRVNPPRFIVNLSTTCKRRYYGDDIK